MRRIRTLAALLALSAAGALAEEIPNQPYTPPPTPEEIPQEGAAQGHVPLIARWLLHPISNGMFVNVPVVGTDPNRGPTAGIMPIWVIRNKNSDTIKEIFAPSFTHNSYYGYNGTMRYYYYPYPEAELLVDGVLSTTIEREVQGIYQDTNFLNKKINLYARVRWGSDGDLRFYGFGPDSPQSAQANYAKTETDFNFLIGPPVIPKSDWKVQFYEDFSSTFLNDFKLPGLQDMTTEFPGMLHRYAKQDNETGLSLLYNSRDNPITTGRGAYLNLQADVSSRHFASSYNYQRYIVDGRVFHPLKSHPDQTLAVQAQFQQVMGAAPIWNMPYLGGKYSLRAYGNWRYIDNGMFSFNVEDRYTFKRMKMAGVTSSFELAPFAGLGTVFPTLASTQVKYLRPVVGAAVRAVVKPEVVGSIDVGIGQEGPAVFTDINYSF